MINLLPPETRENILYARRNTKLFRWSIAMLVGIFGILFVVTFGMFYIDKSTKEINRQVAQARQELAIQKLDETQKRVEDMSSSFKLVTQVLSKQILFSDVLQQAGAVMPSGASLSGLSIEGIQGGIDLQVVSSSYQAGTQVQVNLQDPNNKLFDKVDIVSLVKAPEDTGAYPFSGNYRASFTTNSPFYFLNSGNK